MGNRLENAVDVALMRALNAINDPLSDQRDVERRIETASRLMERLYPVDPDDRDFLAAKEGR